MLMKRDEMVLKPSKAGAFRFTATGLLIEGKPTLADMQAVGDWLSTIHGALQWWIGDWLLYGEGVYADRFSQLLDATQWDADTLRQYEWVCRKVPPENRMPISTGLSFSHHREIADLPPAVQREWLTKAATGTADVPWTCDRLRRELKEAKAPGGGMTFWVLVEAKNPEDADALLTLAQGQGRRAKLVEKRLLPERSGT